MPVNVVEHGGSVCFNTCVARVSGGLLVAPHISIQCSTGCVFPHSVFPFQIFLYTISGWHFKPYGQQGSPKLFYFSKVSYKYKMLIKYNI